MKQEISNAIPGEGSQAGRGRQSLSRSRIQFYRRMGVFLTAALMLMLLGAFASASPAHAQASSGGCWSYNTWSNNATWENSDTPPMYGNDSSTAPALGLALNSCDDYIMVKWSDRGYDYYKVDWTRPGVNGWQHFTVSGSADNGYMYYNFNNAHFGTYYNFAVKGCTRHWYGDSCDDWSPTVGINT